MATFWSLLKEYKITGDPKSLENNATLFIQEFNRIHQEVTNGSKSNDSRVAYEVIWHGQKAVEDYLRDPTKKITGDAGYNRLSMLLEYFSSY